MTARDEALLRDLVARARLAKPIPSYSWMMGRPGTKRHRYREASVPTKCRECVKCGDVCDRDAVNCDGCGWRLIPR